jgi:hypothetical protein
VNLRSNLSRSWSWSTRGGRLFAPKNRKPLYGGGVLLPREVFTTEIFIELGLFRLELCKLSESDIRHLAKDYFLSVEVEGSPEFPELSNGLGPALTCDELEVTTGHGSDDWRVHQTFLDDRVLEFEKGFLVEVLTLAILSNNEIFNVQEIHVASPLRALYSRRIALRRALKSALRHLAEQKFFGRPRCLMGKGLLH